MPDSYRIAFLAPAYVTEPNAGGMASYIARMARALADAGNTPEIFVLSPRGPDVIHHNSIRVQLVNPLRPQGPLKWFHKAATLPLLRSFRGTAQLLAGAAQLADALEERDRQAPFDLVQSSEYCATGWYVPPRPGRRHVVRCSGARELLAAVDQGDSKSIQRSWIHYELESVRRADIAYAPSQYVAGYYHRRLGRPIPVVRPPLHTASPEPGVPLPDSLPARYLLHFGQLRAYKGTPWLLDALPLAWKTAPDLQLLLVGPIRNSDLRKRLARLLAADQRITHLDTVHRPQMYAILKNAVAAVLPSLADNLPNTAIESLSLGIPVIGTHGASIDELMQSGRHGELVPLNDVPALARAMARAWLGQSVARGFVWDAPIIADMAPLQSLIALGKVVGMDLAHQMDPPHARP